METEELTEEELEEYKRQIEKDECQYQIEKEQKRLEEVRETGAM